MGIGSLLITLILGFIVYRFLTAKTQSQTAAKPPAAASSTRTTIAADKETNTKPELEQESKEFKEETHGSSQVDDSPPETTGIEEDDGVLIEKEDAELAEREHQEQLASASQGKMDTTPDQETEPPKEPDEGKKKPLSDPQSSPTKLLTTDCPKCGSSLLLPVDQSKKVLQCPECGEVFTVQLQEEEDEEEESDEDSDEDSDEESESEDSDSDIGTKASNLKSKLPKRAD
jgi:DNA-directed RNA polymerase subunit M/transcription elongation factor TFIIS